MGNPSFFFPSLCFVCIVSYPFTVSHSACLFSLWPFTRYLKTGIKLFLYYLFLRWNKADSPRHKDSTPDAASQVSNTVKKENFLPPGSYTFVWSYLSTARPQCNLYSIYCPPEFPGIFNGPAFFFKLFPSLYYCIGLTLSQFQNFRSTCAELHKVSVSLFLKLAKIPLKIYPALPRYQSIMAPIWCYPLVLWEWFLSHGHNGQWKTPEDCLSGWQTVRLPIPNCYPLPNLFIIGSSGKGSGLLQLLFCLPIC